MIEFVRGDLAAVGRTVMSHPDYGLRITLYPIFHIGSPSFYEALSTDLARFRVFLLEGVRWRGLRGPLYDLLARNLGLVTQGERLRIPPDGEQLPLDMTELEFAQEARCLPLQWRLVLRFLRPMLWAATLTDGGRHAVWDSFSKRSYVRGLRRRDGPLRQLIKTKRDKAMTERLRGFAQDPSRIAKAAPVAVVSGAAHMPALYSTLRDCGYEKGNVRWFEVLDGLQIPSRSAAGRASGAGP